MRANNLTLLTDLYELTMMQGYFKNPTDQTVVFDMFYRDNPCGGGFAICAGLEQVIEYIENLRFTDADIEYLRGLSIFEEDFSGISSLLPFYRRYLCHPGRHCYFPKRANGESGSTDYGSSACGNCDFEHYEPSEPDCY